MSKRESRPAVGPRFHGPNFGEIKKAASPKKTVGRIWSYLRRQSRLLIGSAVLVALSSFTGLVGPYLMSVAIDRTIVTKDLPALVIICCVMLAVYLTTSLLTWLQNYLMAGVAQETVSEIRADLFLRLQSFPLRFFDQRPHGELMSRLTNDVERVSQVLTDSVTQLVSGVLGMVGVAIMMFVLNPIMAAVSIGTLVVVSFLINKQVIQRTRVGFRAQQASLGTLNGLIEESIEGRREITAFRREAVILKEFDGTNAELRKAATHAQIFAGVIGPFMNLTGNCSQAVVVGVGGILVVKGLATVGTIAAFVSYSRQFGRPLNEIANLINTIQSAIAGAERVFEIIDEQPEVDALPSSSDVDLLGEVSFENVCFSYDGERQILKNVTLHAKPGDTIALIGPTGAGKTTIINLLTRFYEIDSGQIRLDGRDLREIPKEELRRQLGIVLQDTFLFAGSIRENIRYGRLDATDAEVEHAAVLSNADSYIRHLPEGYETVLTERGGNLSHGQRQMLAIARAILANPRVLILDEATSSVDTRTEKHIQEAMHRLMQGRTSFVIAHRLSTIRDADQIIVISAGEVIERGNHDELLAQQGFYYRLQGGK